MYCSLFRVHHLAVLSVVSRLPAIYCNPDVSGFLFGIIRTRSVVAYLHLTLGKKKRASPDLIVNVA